MNQVVVGRLDLETYVADVQLAKPDSAHNSRLSETAALNRISLRLRPIPLLASQRCPVWDGEGKMEK